MSILRETLRFQKENNSATRYEDVEIDIPDEFLIVEKWQGEDDLFYSIEFPMKDIVDRIRSARDHLRYLKQKDNTPTSKTDHGVFVFKPIK